MSDNVSEHFTLVMADDDPRARFALQRIVETAPGLLSGLGWTNLPSSHLGGMDRGLTGQMLSRRSQYPLSILVPVWLVRQPVCMIELSGVTKTYGDRLAVDDLSVTIEPGRVTGFLGPNGAGKSTTLRLILGLDRPDRGTATVGGVPFRRLERPLGVVGAHLDGRSAHPGRTARAHLLALARYNRIPTSRVEEVCAAAGITEVARSRVGRFSLGMTQRLGIAAALLGDPAVLLLDEPFNGLDADGVRWIRTLLRRMAAEGRTVLVSSHLLAEMHLTADHLVVLGRGRLLADCPTEELVDAAAEVVLVEVPDPAERLRLQNALTLRGITVMDQDGELRAATSDVGAVGDCAHAEGVRLHLLTRPAGTLEDGYRRLVGDQVEFRSVAA